MTTDKIICFDLEGPLSPQDNAYEAMALAPKGDRVFEVLSRYDDLVALEQRAGYEPGDTLALIVPFLLLHSIKEEDISRVSSKAMLVDGAKELISALKNDGWHVQIISTSYRQHAYSIGAQLNVPEENISCTQLDLEGMHDVLSSTSKDVIEHAEKDILEIHEHMDDKQIKERLDRFFYQEMLETEVGDVFARVRVVGGARKVEAMSRVLSEHNVPPENAVAVGDSITDWKMLQLVRDADGLAIVFNGNEYAVPCANMGLASTDIRFLHGFINLFHQKGLEDALRIADTWEREQPMLEKALENMPPEITTPMIKDFLENLDDEFEAPHIHNLRDADDDKQQKVIKIHKHFRQKVRGQAAKLG